MSSLHSSSSSSSSASRRHKYDVFLSFRGEDTRKNFTDHLHAALKRSGIITFKDNEMLELGEEIAPELLKAIGESWCSIIVFSENYAYSRWCLDELAEIIKEREERGHKVFPIFYEVDPSNLRKLTGRVGEGFAKNEERFKDNKEMIERWQYALTQLANLKGWHLDKRPESEFIGDIVRGIWAKLPQKGLVVDDDSIGINTRLEELHSKIDIREDDVRIIGICGMGGLGKTTLARAIYTQMSPHFEGKCFLEDVREVSEKHGLVFLQKQLLSQILSVEGFHFSGKHDGIDMISRNLSLKKVLVVLDDVDDIQHLDFLVGKRDGFHLGSRVIITTRDEHLLRSYGVDDVYMPTTLNDDEALRLFSLNAFNCGTMPRYGDDFFELSCRVLEYADGLPLALKVLGSFLCGRDVAQWRSAIERLRMNSRKEILDRLQISFDGLEETEKNIFLDIACFFKGEDKNFVIKILDGCNFFPDIGIDVLIRKSLITIDEYDRLRMHDLLQEMGRKIVQQKSIDEPGRRCRLWEERDVYHVLKENTGSEAVEGMIIDIKSYQLTPQISNFWSQVTPRIFMFWEQEKTFFSKMKKLRLLRVFNPLNFGEIHYLSKDLRLLEWPRYPFKSLPSNFQPDNLVALLLPYSHIEKLWTGNIQLDKLKLVNLKGCQNLVKTPTFEMTPNLESLILKDCTQLVHVHPSIGFLRRLKLLDLRDCKSLKTLPTKIGMQSLEKLFLSGCLSLEKFPDIDGEMKCLVELHLDGTSIKQLPSSIGNLSNLVLLNLKDCKNLASLPRREGLKCLKTLNLSGCKVNSMSLVLPPSLSRLTSLTELHLSDCNLHEGAIPSDICGLSSLKWLDLSGNNFISLPPTLTLLSKLKYLRLSDCKELKSLPELLTSIHGVYIEGCDSLEVFASPATVLCNSGNFSFIYGVDCYKLVENNNTWTMLKEYLKVFANSRRSFDVYIPGSEIPEWFSHWSEGPSLNMAWPPLIRNDSKWIGIAVCCQYYSILNKYGYQRHNYGYYYVTCNVIGRRGKYTLNHLNSRRSVGSLGEPFGGPSRRKQRDFKDHLLVSYWPIESLRIYRLRELSTTCLADDELMDEIKFLFYAPNCSGFKIKKCGVRIVHEKDLEEIAEFVKEASGDVGSALVKRKRYVYEAAGPSESHEETPPTKR